MIIIVRNKLKAICALGIFIAASVVIGRLAYHGGMFVYEASGITSSSEKYIAIIIDDFGNNSEGTKEMLALDIALTAAVMPGMASSAQDAYDFYSAGKEVILHMPMEAVKGKDSWLGPRALRAGMDVGTVNELVNAGLDELKYAKGINNHMGSKITADESIMNEVVSIAKSRDIIIIDSKTTQKSVVKKLADKWEVRCLERDVFLDGTQEQSKIEKQMHKAYEVAKKKGYAVAIGHVGKEGGIATARAIQSFIDSVADENLHFVTVTQMYSLFEQSSK